MRTRTEQGRLGWMGVAWVFGAVGPGIGGLCAALGAAALMPGLGLGIHDPGDVLLAVFLSYAVGLTPAVITGLICGMTSPAVRGRLAWVTFCGFVGASISFLCLLVALSAIAPGGWRSVDHLDFDVFAVFALTGALAAAGSALVVRNVRPLGRDAATAVDLSSADAPPTPGAA